MAGKQAKSERTQEAIDSASVIDVDVEVNIPKIQTLKEEKKFKCTCCGDSWDTQKTHFSMSKSPLYQCNNGYITICNNCRDKYYYKLIDLFSGNEEKAIQYMCQQFGWFFHIGVLETSRQVSADRSRISHYLAKKNLPLASQWGYTDTDTLKIDYLNRREDVIKTLEDAKDSKRAKLKTVKFFGTGFSDEDYEYLQEQYDDWTTRHECKTKSQEEVFKRIVFKQLEILKATRKGDNTKDLDATYQNLLATGNLQPKQNSLDTLSDAQTLGTLLAKWETTRPLPEVEDELKDVDKVGRYIDVFFKGHLAKMMGLKNALSNLYSKFMKKYTVERPEYEGDENNEALFDAIFGNEKDE